MTASPPDDQLTARGQAARGAILAAATDLFAANGFAATSVTAIADAAQVNRAMIAYYFGSKGGLYDAIIDDAVEAAATSLAQSGAHDDAANPISSVIKTLARVLGERPHFSRMIIHEYFGPGRLFEPDTAVKLSGFVKLTEKALRASALDPDVQRFDPQVVHLIIVGALNYFLLTAPFRQELQGRLDRPLTQPSLDEFAATLATIVSRGLLVTGQPIAES